MQRIFWSWVLVLAGCSQPSFVDNTERVASGDATQNPDDGPFPPGTDPTTGDREDKDPGVLDGGEDDGNVDGGAEDGGDTDGAEDGGDEPEVRTRSMTFDGAVLGAGMVTQDLDDPFLYSEITLAREYSDRSQQVQQVERPVVTDGFDQGHGGDFAMESFDQRANRPLDILIVVDNSGSMKEEQVNLSQRLRPILSYVEDTDWAIGIVTTDPNQTCLRSLIKKGDANIEQKFTNAIQAGTSGSGNERGILMAVRSLAGTCLSSPWIRPDSTLAVLIVSDEDNCSNGNDCSGKDYREAAYLINYLNTIRVAGVNAKVFGLFWHPSHDSSLCPTADYKANIYAAAVDATGGTWGSICDADYSATLEVMSQNIAVVLSRSFTLQKDPVAGSIEVRVDGTPVDPSAYTISGRTVTFAQAPADGSTVSISYRYGAVPIVNSFTLRYDPLPESVSVTVNGMPLDPSEFTVNAANRRVTLASVPPEKAKINVTYKRNVALNDQYVVIDEVKPGSMRIFINSVETTDFTVTYGKNVFNLPIALVKFAAPPPEAAMIDFRYLKVGAPILRYPFMPGTMPVDLVGFDSVTGAPVGVTYSAPYVDVRQADFVEGRRVTLRYDNVARQQFEVDLPHMPLEDSVQAKGGNVTCTTMDTLVLNGQTVMVQDCGFPDSATTVTVSYEYLIEQRQAFVFDVPDLPGENDFQEWRVLIDGVETDAYTREGNVIMLDEPAPVRSKVTIELTERVQ